MTLLNKSRFGFIHEHVLRVIPQNLLSMWVSDGLDSKKPVPTSWINTKDRSYRRTAMIACSLSKEKLETTSQTLPKQVLYHFSFNWLEGKAFKIKKCIETPQDATSNTENINNNKDIIRALCRFHGHKRNAY